MKQFLLLALLLVLASPGAYAHEISAQLDGRGEVCRHDDEPTWVNYWYVYIKNNCHKDIHLAVHYKSTENHWLTNGWWTVGSGNRVEVFHTRNRIVYYHAHTTDGSYYWDGDHSISFNVNDTPYYFAKRDIDSQNFGAYTFNLNCN